jgi:peptidoglycan/xylan/chitin deacetylase (PgdA/CDA1 family)
MFILVAGLTGAACARRSPPAPPTSSSQLMPMAGTTALPAASTAVSASATPSAPPTSLATSSPPPTFTTTDLRPGVEPQRTIADACEALRKRWDPQGSAPGTVVLPIMLHSIRDPARMLDDNVTVSTDYFRATVDLARALGFETITTAELLGFLTDNARIPPRSMILIIDDRRPGVVAEYILPVAEQFDWTVTLGWIIGDTGPSLWSTMEGLAENGRLDVQSHGLQHRYIIEGMPEAEVRQEIAGPIPILEQHFGYRPTAFVWPGGNFTPRSVEIAREEGYQLGFTAFSRGPLLFDWIPLGDEERAAADPLMTLPRAWSPSATVNLEQAAKIGEEAALFAAENREPEASWYSQSCGGSLPSP